ncbi:NUDIX hydrolase [Ectobacillus funiculus]|uniref:NUDIX hydrolase n=1 Tax=Ectobacillus funiculus TaxID=137993 RepID=UPI00101B7491|nr:NUDIX hydrolase [Ectobacillus funiculus]
MNYIQELRSAVGTRPLILTAAGVILLDTEGRILLQHRTDTNDWGLPGGFMEIGETIEDTARREIFEETGLTVGELKLFHIFSGDQMYYEYPNGDQVYNVIICYYSSDIAGEIRLDEESKELRYFDIQSFPENIMKTSKVMLDKYVSGKTE